jgi:hypothetical protein
MMQTIGGRLSLISTGVALAALSLGVVGGDPAYGQSRGGGLFARPFVVEHRVVQTDPDGSVFEAPAVTDTYGGSWIVSSRPDGTRLILDFARREITTVDPNKSTFSVLSFDRMAELRRRLQIAEGEGGVSPDSADNARGERPPVQLAAEDVPVTQGLAAAKEPADTALLGRPGVRRLRVTATRESAGRESAAPASRPASLDVWLDPSVTLGSQAQEALARFERDVLGDGRDDTSASCLAHARTQASGAFPIRTERRAGRNPESDVRIVDQATRLETLTTFPAELLRVPAGFRRVPHPLENVVAWSEEEAARNRAMSGTGK